jgi:hypothetical protein
VALKFVSTDQDTQAQYEFKALLDRSKLGVKMAFAYFSKAGWSLLEEQDSVLAHDDSFLVVSVDWPTDLEALAEVANRYPGKVYLHLGWVTPYERKVGPALMHSKMALGQGLDMWRLWVGSQNMTARAMFSGNMEAALVYETEQPDAPVIDAKHHLHRCRDGAEMFDLARLAEYKQIQANKAFGVGVLGKLLVLYAEEITPITQYPALIHVRIPNEDFDDLTRTGTEAHLIVVPPGSLGIEELLPLGAKRYTGYVVEDNRTEFHSLRGSASTMPKATHWLEMGATPKLIAPNSVHSRPLTQAAIKIDRRPDLQQPSAADEFLYSVTASRVKAEAATTFERLSRREVPKEVLKFYSKDSRSNGDLLFAPREHLTEASQVTIYSGTPIPPRFMEALERTRMSVRKSVARERRIARRVELKVVERPPVSAGDPFFFLSEFRVRSDDETLE